METIDEAQDGHEVRITSHGKMNAWVDFALDFFEKNEDRPLTFHTLPNSRPPATGGTETSGDSPPAEAKPNRMHQSTALIPRLVSVVEIIKREYVKKLDPILAEQGCLSGLHQYNEVGALEEFNADVGQNPTEEDRVQTLAHALQGRNHLKVKKTPYMKITLSRKKLPARKSATYQQPTLRKLSKSARARVKNRLRKEKHAE
ncbi:hypothetical protein NM688_g349 [Phlebia brevispora]|uniref:Uncharacterized protein n=1 Tax=Phlebia brevispora TaxID=194682 RepID=A0ACC1TE84_9APHY|nr:hypothetical protein NM688_g349 [Phlebia brevispora]